MTDTTQGGPTAGAPPPTKADEEPRVERDPVTGINKDMPADEGEAVGRPPGYTFGIPYHR